MYSLESVHLTFTLSGPLTLWILFSVVSTLGCSREYTVKSFWIFLSPAGMPLTKLSQGGNNDVIYKLFPPRESLVRDIPAGDGNIKKFFYGVFSLLAIFSPD